VRTAQPSQTQQGCQFGFFEAKFVNVGLFSTPLAFLAFFGHIDFLCRFGDLKMILAGFWALADF